MTGHRVAVLGVVALALVAGAAGTTAIADGTAPTLSLSIDSTTIESGDEYGTAENPDLSIEAGVGENASAGRELSQVVIRMNDDLYRNYSTAGENFTKTVPLDVDDGENTVRVIVTDSEGRATSITFTVVKDDRRPTVYLTEPYVSAPYNPIGDGSTNGSWTRFNATVIDDSNATTGTMTIRWNDSNDVYRTSVPITDIGSSFSKRVFLGLGTNRIRLTVTDEYGNTRIDEFDVDVDDTEAPTIALDEHPTRIEQSAFVLSGNVSDDVWLDKARIVATQVDGDERIEKKIRRSANYRINPERTNASFEKTLYFLQAGTYVVKVTARDETGKLATRTFRLERVEEKQRSVVPEISVDRDRTTVLAPDTLFLAGQAFDGQIRRVVVETRDPATGETVGYHPVFSGTNKPSVEFERNVTIQPNRTRVVVRVTDAEGGEHTREFFVDGATGEAFVGNGSDPTADGGPSDRATPTEAGRTGSVDTDERTSETRDVNRNRAATSGQPAGAEKSGSTDAGGRTQSPAPTERAGDQATGSGTSTSTRLRLPDLEVVGGFVALVAAIGAAMLWVARREG